MSNFSNDFSGKGVLTMDNWAGVLFIKFLSNNLLFSVKNRAMRRREADGLVGRLVGTLPG